MRRRPPSRAAASARAYRVAAFDRPLTPRGNARAPGARLDANVADIRSPPTRLKPLYAARLRGNALDGVAGVAAIAQDERDERTARRRVRVIAPGLANVGDERPAPAPIDAEPRAALPQVAPGQQRESGFVVPPMRALRIARVELVAIRGDDDGMARVRIDAR